MTAEPEWLTVDDVVLFHEQLIATFGGASGTRDRGLLESALSRPQNVFAFESRDLCVLAKAYAHGIAKNHPFIDGNKRAAFVLVRVFLGLNGVRFDPPEPETVAMIEGLASSKLSEADFVSWVRMHSG
jgi:death-on-curing protein